ncbi:hypothetical protein CI109_103188 [Kwoniella shandongensis]|uniref:Uncharacterized protein n=1 Tax=Kwoniella shandongensis TaxID=1734106 RepID=A0A5M6C8R1_9TREE|nr:uncharacterized protein CI109_000379 [Kwoniella shandongensis]KAA5531537.1 hypothetical protein CI109_000379 [Kwoniella shandongensis]
MQYYNTPAMPPNMGMGGVGGMGMGMDPRMQQMQQMQAAQMGQGGMMNGMGGYGQAWRNLGYDYAPPQAVYKPEAGWGAWDLANAQYNGGRLERSFFDNIVRLLREYQSLLKTHNLQEDSQSPSNPNFKSLTNPTGGGGLMKQISSLTNFFANRHLSEDSARDAHRRVYYQGEGVDAGNKTLGGAAAYQAYLIWDRDHYSAYHSMPSQENRERLVGLAVAELFSLWDRVQPRSTRASTEEAAQYAAATAKYLFDRHYDIPHNHSHRRSSRYSGYGADNDSDSDDDRHMRRRGMYNQQQPYGVMGMGMGQGPMMGGMGSGMYAGGAGGGMIGGGGMPGMGMPQPGMGAMGMPGAMQNGMMGMQPGMGMGMGGGGMGAMQPGMGGGMGGMGMQHGMGMGGMGMMGGMQPGGYGNPMNEAQASPGMHPYHYGAQSGVAYGSQPIDQMGNPTFPGGPGRSWYGYGQPRYF